jgi:glycosyltransferase involved in cell wall biosynthesis
MYNEVEKGNLVRCLNNCKKWADDIFIYDDASTDNSVEVAKQYTNKIIYGEKNNIYQELSHKQQLLEFALQYNPDWIMWIDCDEILDRTATNGGLRSLCYLGDIQKIDAFQFHEVNLWRGESYARLDTFMNIGWFVRLWKVTPNIRFDVIDGVHKRLYPITIEKAEKVTMQVIHYGFCNYKNMMVKIGAHLFNKKQLIENASTNWILNESNLRCYKVPLEWFPKENIPEKESEEPKPINLDNLKTYGELYG